MTLICKMGLCGTSNCVILSALMHYIKLYMHTHAHTLTLTHKHTHTHTHLVCLNEPLYMELIWIEFYMRTFQYRCYKWQHNSLPFNMLRIYRNSDKSTYCPHYGLFKQQVHSEL